MQITGQIGRKTLNSVNHISNLCALTYKLLRLLVQKHETGRALMKRVVIEQIYFTAVQALLIIIPIALIVGSMLIIQFAKLSGQYDLGKTMVLIIIRELGPMITALIVILRSATSVVIEIGYMNVFNEIDAIEMAGVDPLRYVCLPRLIGITSAVFCLFIVFDLVAIIGGYAVIWTTTYIPVGNFLTQIGKALTVDDIILSVIKALCFGITITVTCIYHGFSVKKQITNIPVETSRAAIECFFYCLLINLVISVLFYI